MVKTVELPNTVTCQFCDCVAEFDSKTTLGPWAYLCSPHFVELGVLSEAAYRLRFRNE